MDWFEKSTAMTFDRRHYEDSLIKKHGCIDGLRPIHVIQTAEADLARHADGERIRKMRRYARECGASAEPFGTPPSTTFILAHLAVSASVEALLRAALSSEHLPDGDGYSKCTCMVYNDKPLLRAAIELVKAINKNKKAIARVKGEASASRVESVRQANNRS